MSANILGEDLFSTVVSEIKNYDGKDPLRPWVHGIKKLQEKLPSDVLREKLPRFLQKCVQAFQSDTRYHNDSRYVGVWIKLMDFVDEPRALLRMMEKSQIGTKRATFYMAYSIYFEKKKQFEEADKMYHLGVKNLAEPVDEMQKAYEQFLHRMELYKRRKQKQKETKAKMGTSCLKSLKAAGNLNTAANSRGSHVFHETTLESSLFDRQDNEATDVKRKTFTSGDTVVVKFVGSAIVGRFEAENACHHGLVDPTINMEEAMNAISDMFREPLELDSKVKQKSHTSTSQAKQLDSNNLEVFLDDTFTHQENQNRVTSAMVGRSEGNRASHHELVDPTINMKEAMNAIGNMFREPIELDSKLKRESSRKNARKDQLHGAGCLENQKKETDQTVGRSRVENVCHHGLVDPTINMKEAMDAVGIMFREPIELPSKPRREQCSGNSVVKQIESNNLEVFVDTDLHQQSQRREANTSQKKHVTGSSYNCRLSRDHQLEKHAHGESSNPFMESFHILADDEFEDSHDKEKREIRKTNDAAANICRDVKPREDTMIRRFFDSYIIDGADAENVCHHGLVDPTINLKEAMDEINGMFGQPIAFVRPKRNTNEDDLPSEKQDYQGFSIYTDEDKEEPPKGEPSQISSKPDVMSDLFEPTVFTKEALDDINAMFGKALDF